MLPYRDVENETRGLYPIALRKFSKINTQELTNHELGIRVREEGAENTSDFTHFLHHPVIG